MEGGAGSESADGEAMPAERPQEARADAGHAGGGRIVGGESAARSFDSSASTRSNRRSLDPVPMGEETGVVFAALLRDGSWGGSLDDRSEGAQLSEVRSNRSEGDEDRTAGSGWGSDEDETSRGENEEEEEARDAFPHPLDTLDKPCMSLPPQLSAMPLRNNVPVPSGGTSPTQSAGVGLTLQWADIKDSVFTDKPCQRTAFKPVQKMDSLSSIQEIDTGEEEVDDSACNDNIKAATREAWYNKARVVVDRKSAPNHLGKGPASVVYRATLDEQDAIIKIISLKEPNPAALSDIIAAMRTTHKIGHRNLVSFYGGSFTPDADILFIFSEHMYSGSMEQFFVSKWTANKGKLFTKSWKPSTAISASWICDVARGLCFLHEFQPACIHGHLSMSNILLSQDLSIAKVSDYVFNSKFQTRTEHPGEDIYALGLIIFQLGIGKLIWKEEAYTAARTGLKEKDSILVDVKKVKPEAISWKDSIFVDIKKVKPEAISDKRLRSLFIQCSAPMSDTSEIGIRQIVNDFEQEHLQNIGKQLKV